MLLHVLGKFYRVVDSSPMGERVVGSSEETKKSLRAGALSDSFYMLYLVHPARFERATPGFEVQCSIQLSYGCRSAEQNVMDTTFVNRGQWESFLFRHFEAN